MENREQTKEPRRFQYSLRTLVLGTILAGLGLGIAMKPYSDYANAVRKAEEIVKMEEKPKDSKELFEKCKEYEFLINNLRPRRYDSPDWRNKVFDVPETKFLDDTLYFKRSRFILDFLNNYTLYENHPDIKFDYMNSAHSEINNDKLEVKLLSRSIPCDVKKVPVAIIIDPATNKVTYNGRELKLRR